MRGARVAIVLHLIAVGAPTASAQAPLREGYETIGEGLTAATSDGTIEFGWRMFTIYTVDEACRRARADLTARLRSDTPRLTAHGAEPFSPARLKIVAVDRAGRVLPRVPIGVELKAPPGFFVSRLPDGRDAPLVPLGTGPLVPLKTGTAMLRARTLCRASSAEVLIAFDARP
jgi:hypothetical protein